MAQTVARARSDLQRRFGGRDGGRGRGAPAVPVGRRGAEATSVTGVSHDSISHSARTFEIVCRFSNASRLKLSWTQAGTQQVTATTSVVMG